MKRLKKKISLSVATAFILLAIGLLCAVISKCSDNEDSLSQNVPRPGNTDAYSSGYGNTGASSSGCSNADLSFSAYTDELFRQEAAASLLNLHYTLEDPENFGITEYSTDLGEYSADNPLQAAAFAENVRQVLTQFDADTLSVDNRLTLDILNDSLTLTGEAAAFSYYEEPLRPSTGIQSELPILLAEYTFQDVQDISDYLALLSSIPDYFAGICQYEKEKSAAGLFMSDFAADKIISQCTDFAASGEDNYLIYTFDEKMNTLEELTKNERISYQKQNRAVILGKVLPAFQNLADTLTSLKGSGKNPAGLCGFEEGKSYYEYLVREATGSSDPVAELKERTENQRISDLSEAAALLTANPGLEDEIQTADAPCETPEEMIGLLKTAISEDFPEPPDCESTIKYVDEAMEDYLAPAFYLTSPMDHLTENSIYINRKNNYEGIRLFTTLAHEGYPGHLYQNVVFHSSDPAPIRALLGCAGYAEGWATFVELKSYRYAEIPEYAARLLALDQSAILSLYAIADIGIHYDGWSYTDTYVLFSDYGVTDESAVRDIFELIVEEPAHYLKYYIGYLEFLSLEDYAKELYGENFSEKNFHQAVLEIGPAPFDIVKKYLPEYYPADIQN